MDRKLILVIDPDEQTSQLLSERFNGSVEVVSVPEGRRGMQLARQGSIDLALVAQCLPHMGGLDVLKALKEFTPALQIVFLASQSDEDLIISAFRAGAQDFLRKPLTSEDLAKSLAPLLLREEANRNGKSDMGTGTGAGIPDVNGEFQPFARFGARIDEVISQTRRWYPFRLLRSRQERPDLTETQESSSTQTKRKPASLKESSDQTEFSINFLGHFHTILDSQFIDSWPSKKGKLLFAYLAYNRQRRIPRDVLMDLFWPNSDPDSARNSLNVAIHCMRHFFQKQQRRFDFILFKDECYYLNPELNADTDVENFLRHWRVAQSLEREKGIQEALSEYELAAALYKGDFMEEDIYEDWTTLERENLKEIYLVILDRLSKYYGSDGKPMIAVNLCQTILGKDNCREDIHRRLMKCYYRIGQRNKALKQFQTCTDILRRELGVQPSRSTRELYEQIKLDSSEFDTKKFEN